MATSTQHIANMPRFVGKWSVQIGITCFQLSSRMKPTRARSSSSSHHGCAVLHVWGLDKREDTTDYHSLGTVCDSVCFKYIWLMVYVWLVGTGRGLFTSSMALPNIWAFGHYCKDFGTVIVGLNMPEPSPTSGMIMKHPRRIVLEFVHFLSSRSQSISELLSCSKVCTLRAALAVPVTQLIGINAFLRLSHRAYSMHKCITKLLVYACFVF